MQFENVIGQKATKKHLIDLVQQNRLSHALLFLGKEGSGALAMALAFAQYIVCTSAKSETPAQAGLFGEEDITMIKQCYIRFMWPLPRRALKHNNIFILIFIFHFR